MTRIVESRDTTPSSLELGWRYGEVRVGVSLLFFVDEFSLFPDAVAAHVNLCLSADIDNMITSRIVDVWCAYCRHSLLRH